MVSALKPGAEARYTRGQDMFQAFARAHAVPNPYDQPLTVMMIVGFVVWIVSMGGWAVSTAKRWKTAVRSMCVDFGLDVSAFKSPLLRRVLRGLERKHPAKKRAPKLPITTTILYKFLLFATITEPLECILFAVACVGVYGMFRASDLVYRGAKYTLLRRRDITWSGRDVLLNLRSSKHDYFDRGEAVRLHSTEYATSPVHWLKRAFMLAPDKSHNAPAFQNMDGSAISYQQLQVFLKRLACAVGLTPSGVSSRSLRIGGATTLAAMRVPIYTLKAMGRWKSLSYQLYTQLTEGATQRAFDEMGQLSQRSSSRPFGALSVEEACCLTFDSIPEAFQLRE
jgi:hypothetical protein